MLYLLVLFTAAVCVSGEFTLVDRRGIQIAGEAQGLLLYNGGTVCDDSFDENSANAVCREMGYDRAQTWNSHVTWMIQAQYEIVLDDVICDETGTWDACSYVESHNCGHSEDVFLTCQETPSFKLVDSAGNVIRGGELGLLLYNGGTVCDDSFNNNAANAICRHMGYTGATRWDPADNFDIQSNYEISLDNVSCRRGEWGTCTYSESHNCMHREDVFLSCDGQIQPSDIPTVPTVPTDTELFTLVDSEGSDIEGEQLGLLLYQGGTVCDDSFDNTAADAICRHMGYTDAARWTSRGASFDIQSDYEINLDNVDCSSAEWDTCSFSEDHNCGHSEDVFLSCNSEEGETPTESGLSPFSLVDSEGDEIVGEHRGLLLFNGGTVCDDSFTDNAANAICRKMGHPGSLEWTAGSIFDIQRDLEIGLDNVDCSSEEWSSCSHSEDHNCVHSEDVFLMCQSSAGNPTEPPNVETDPPIVETDAPIVETDAPIVETDPPIVETAPTSVETDPPIVETAPTSVDTVAPDPSMTCPPQLPCPVPTCPSTPTCPPNECPECPDCPNQVCPECPVHECPDLICPAGHYPVNSTCVQCPENSYSSVPGSSSCVSCPGTSTSQTGSTKCECRPGTQWLNGRCKRCPDDYAGVKGVCKQCPVGAQPVDSDRSCTCPDGQYWLWSHELEGTCVPCPEGKFKAGEMSQCELCPTGSTSPTGSRSCSCEAGSYWSDGNCEQCSSGSASNAEVTVCIACENGAAEDQSSCVCDNGLVWEWVDQNTGSCKPCLPNTYKTGNMSTCSACPTGSTSSAGAEHCICPAGKFWSGQDCNTSCEAGSVSTEGSLSCSICPSGSSSTEKNTSCTCPDGMTWDWNRSGEGSCKPCSAGTYRSGEVSTCQVCPEGSTSLSGSGNCSCGAGFFWSGTQCSECEEGTASTEGATECTACSLGSAEDKASCTCSDGAVWKWETGTGYCAPCLTNTYKLGDMESCETCPSTSTSPAGAAECTCNSGTFWSNRACVMCTGNAFFDDAVKVCVQCPGDTLPTNKHTACSCTAGHKWDSPTKTCTSCPENHYSNDSSIECTKCPLYTVSVAGAQVCQPCENGKYWNDYTCDICNDSDQIGNGVFCVQQYDIKPQQYKGSAKELMHGPRKGVSAIFTGIIVILAVVCMTLAVLLVVKRRKHKKKKAVTMSYSTAPLTGGSENDWQDMRADGEAGPNHSGERSWCGEASNPMPGSEENIYTFLQEPDERF